MTQDHITIFDTTLRDGEQAPGASMNLDEKCMVADMLDRLGVDVIEAGFAAASPGDAEAVRAVAERVENAVVCSLARARRADIEAAAEAIKPARQGRIHTFLSTSPLHRKHKLNMDEAQVIEAIRDSVSYARNFAPQVEWSPEDATRTEPDFLCRAVETAIRAGATSINVPDTVGYTTPDEFFELITMLRARVPGIDKAVISVHCHNDLGLAVANSLAAVRAGARQVECTVNGIGERAGNAALEEIVMAMRTRPDLYPYQTNIHSEEITRASRLVSRITGFQVQKNKAIVGANAFAHESGIHQDGMLKHAGTYEIMTPESVGLSRSSLTLGKLSGRHAFRNKLEELGFELGDNALTDAFARFKQLADKKREIFDNDLIALVGGEVTHGEDRYRLEHLAVHCGTEGVPTAELRLHIDGQDRSIRAEGDGPVDAIFRAIKEASGEEPHLQLYQVEAVTGGTDAQAQVVVRLEKDGRIADGHAADTDTLTASARAYVNALNTLRRIQDTLNAQTSDVQAVRL